jgi:hypothetical protein
MTKLQRQDVNWLLNEVAKALDITDTLFEEAERKYKAVGVWLGEGNSPLATLSPQIYPQGSFLLGTMTKPADDSDDYDVDLVFELRMRKDQVTQKELKQMVGDRLKEHDTCRRLLDKEGRRCWTLRYADSAHFHLDILPAIPDVSYQLRLKTYGVPDNLAAVSIAITDNTLPSYSQTTSDWPHCNPLGYATWFKGRMMVRFTDMQKSFAANIRADVQAVPEYKIKTPLQRSIQLLKRHRDLAFVDNPEIQPASIIITTLAAQAYNNEADLAEALYKIIRGMPRFITKRDGVSWVDNPVDPSENFADRWKDHPQREPSFYLWMKKVMADFDQLFNCEDLDEVAKLLTARFGERMVNPAVNRLKEQIEKRGIASRFIVPVAPPVVIIKNPSKPWGDK